MVGSRVMCVIHHRHRRAFVHCSEALQRPPLTRATPPATISVMANPDRLSALDTAFLHLEDDSTAHMHVASVMVFEGVAPTPKELTDHVLSRLHLVPRYRQRLAYVPLDQGRPLWTDDPH